MRLPPERDDALEQYATPRQWQYAEAIWKFGTYAEAAQKFGVDRSTLSKRMTNLMRKASAAGYSPRHDLVNPVPDGYRLKGASTLYNRRTGEPILQWVKSQVDPDAQEEFWRQRIAELAEDLPRLDPAPPPVDVSEDLMTGYPVSDPHLGMYAWNEETLDDDYDLGIAENLHHRAMKHLVDSSPRSSLAVVALLGDIFHYDGLDPVTPRSKNQLDSDGRFSKMARAGIRVSRRMIDLALARHQHVQLVVSSGNHDPSTAAFLRECLATLYENEPRMTVDRSSALYHYVEFGKNLIGVHHGDRAKLEALPLILAHDQSEAWGRTKYRTWWTGHTHRDRVVDVAGTRVESFKTLIPRDAYASGAGYRSSRGMVSIVLHRELGEVARYTVSPDMLSGCASTPLAADYEDPEG